MLRAFIALLLLLATPALAQDPACVPPVDAPRAIPMDARGLRVGLALGSGSMHGLAHVGVIQALEASGLEVHVVTGTSVGAVIGAMWASGMGAGEIARVSLRTDWDDIGRVALASDGLMTNEPVRETLARLFAGRPIEAWPRRFGAVATNMANGQRRLLVSGDGARAVQASSAVPLLFRPINVAGEKLADGVLVEPVPVQAARDLGAQFVIAVDVAYRPYEDTSRGITGPAYQAMHIVTNELAQRQLRDADFALRLDVHHRFMACGAAGLVDEGRRAMLNAAPALDAALERAARVGAAAEALR